MEDRNAYRFLHQNLEQENNPRHMLKYIFYYYKVHNYKHYL